MIRCPLSTLLTAALGTAALSSVLAQGTATKPTSTPPASTGPAAKPIATPPKSSPPKKTTPASSSEDAITVGSVDSQPITWGQLITKMQVEFKPDLNGAVGQVIAGEASDTLFGPHPKETFTITRAKALSDLRQHPTQKIVQVLDSMLIMKAIDQAATRENVQPTLKEVNAKVDDVLQQLRKQGVIPPNETFDQFLKEHNMTLDKLRTNYRPQVQVLNLVRKQTIATLGHPIGPADMIQASHILIKVPDPSATATSDEKTKADTDALDKIKKILADIRANKISFADAAKANSEDGSKDKGGDLGIFMHGMMVKEFENAAFSAKPDVVTEPVRSQFGYHLILVTKTGNEISPADRQKFIDDYIEKQVPAYVQNLRDHEKVVNKLQDLLPKQPIGSAFGTGRPNAPRPR